MKIALSILIAAAVIIACIFLFVFVGRGNEDSKLESIVKEVQQLILDEKYDEARIKAMDIRVKKEGLNDSRYDKWEQQRQELIELIEEKQKSD